jgi:16S rRNA (uracil1498-N3)-methyltransferase
MELFVSVPGFHLSRLIVDALPAVAGSCRIGGAEAAHASARRLRRGDRVVLIDGSGREAVGRIAARGARSLDVAVESIAEAPPDAVAAITLAVSAVRAERLAWVAEKATELGVARLVIVRSERTQTFRAGEGVTSRLEHIVREAAKQSERARWPAIDGPIALAAYLASEAADAGNRLVLDSRGEAFPSALTALPTALLIGPEGGWSEADLGAVLSAGWSVASLAAGVLRAETAAVAALALARAALARGPSSLSR